MGAVSPMVWAVKRPFYQLDTVYRAAYAAAAAGDSHALKGGAGCRRGHIEPAIMPQRYLALVPTSISREVSARSHMPEASTAQVMSAPTKASMHGGRYARAPGSGTRHPKSVSAWKGACGKRLRVAPGQKIQHGGVARHNQRCYRLPPECPPWRRRSRASPRDGPAPPASARTFAGQRCANAGQSHPPRPGFCGLSAACRASRRPVLSSNRDKASVVVPTSTAAPYRPGMGSRRAASPSGQKLSA